MKNPDYTVKNLYEVVRYSQHYPPPSTHYVPTIT